MSTKWKDIPKEPDFRYVHSKDYGVPSKSQSEALQNISRAHIDSFNFVLRQGIGKAIQNIWPQEFELPTKDRLKLELKDATVGHPVIHQNTIEASSINVYPAECRLRGTTYKAKLEVLFSWSLNGTVQEDIYKVIGQIPIMVKSDACNIKSMSPAELIRRGEEAEEFGGYFIVDGKERIIRFLINQRRNYPIALERPSWKNDGTLFTEYGVYIRCSRPDQTSNPMVLHYLSDGTAKLMFFYRKEKFFVPVMMMLKALSGNLPDIEIFNELTKDKDDDFYKSCIVNMMRNLLSEKLLCPAQVRTYIGERFRVRLNLPDWYTSEELMKYLLKQYICVHLDKDVDKFNLLVFMTRKLFAFAKKECAAESADNPMNHEILLSGHLYLEVLKHHLEAWLVSVKMGIIKHSKIKGTALKFTKSTMLSCLRYGTDITPRVENFLKTGNFRSYNMGLSQTDGFCIVAEKLNFWRYLSHFRAVHRGQYFAKMRTTTVRKLLPEAWGFLCPVHTPDGAPCGLLNHLTAMCEVTNDQPSVSRIHKLLAEMGMDPYWGCFFTYSPKDCYSVLLDGRLVGWVYKEKISSFVQRLRYLKSKGNDIPSMLEIGFVPKSEGASQYPGLFLFSTPSRMMRPVYSLISGEIEMIGTMEQVYLHICVEPSENQEGVTMHQELSRTSILSILGNMIPYSDFNPSPRNMYECQMGKQTMGTPCHALAYRADNKLYRLQNPQTPFVRPVLYDHYKMDDYPMGTNAIVAVMSYTGYDMEDAIVFNKASVERGFKHGNIYKTEVINLRSIAGTPGTQITYMFGYQTNDKDKAKTEKLAQFVDKDGLPFIGTRLKFGDPVCSYIDLATSETVVHHYKSTDTAYVQDVKLLGNDLGNDILQKICVTFRIPRNPTVGDKFASRHGQKGIVSFLLPQQDMPFTESGMVPDIMFNPHGFPSRMTIGMMVESMAGKAGALHGALFDSTPFMFSEELPPSKYFATCLEKAGYNYLGNEKMYSGTSGKEFSADIFIGIVNYQRLRHMVADKFQVRTTGPVDRLTHQPVKGRKNDGGVRFGEMERDALLAHGASFLLHDRLLNCSDKSRTYICTKCHSILTPFLEKPPPAHLPSSREARRDWTCRTCKSSAHMEVLDIPYVFRYLVAEFASINIKVVLKLEDK